MIFSFWKKQSADTLLSSDLFNEKSFYKQFLKDLSNCKEEIIIESPYITSSRMSKLIPIFQALLEKGIQIHIITRDPSEHEENMRHQSTNEILYCDKLGINIILLKGNHHRKLAIIDRSILWEGSLNILSYCNSLEVMRRTNGKEITEKMLHFLSLDKLI